MKVLSVIIPIYNTPKPLLEHCLASIQENICNMGEEVEVFLINDGSPNQYIESMLKKAEASDSRFHHIYKQNSGVSDTRNLGIDMAQAPTVPSSVVLLLSTTILPFSLANASSS